VQIRPVPCVQTDRQTDITKLSFFFLAIFRPRLNWPTLQTLKNCDSHPTAVGVQLSPKFITFRVSFLKGNCRMHSFNDLFTSWLSYKALADREIPVEPDGGSILFPAKQSIILLYIDSYFKFCFLTLYLLSFHLQPNFTVEP
jgi:hypothetical protein